MSLRHDDIIATITAGGFDIGVGTAVDRHIRVRNAGFRLEQSHTGERYQVRKRSPCERCLRDTRVETARHCSHGSIFHLSAESFAFSDAADAHTRERHPGGLSLVFCSSVHSRKQYIVLTL